MKKKKKKKTDGKLTISLQFWTNRLIKIRPQLFTFNFTFAFRTKLNQKEANVKNNEE